MNSVKLITLNIWGGHVHEPLLKFMAAHQDIDIFCLQEVYHNAPHKISDEERHVELTIFSQLHNQLANHALFFRPVVQGIYGIGMLVKKDVIILGEGEVLIHDNPDYPGIGPTHQRNLQWLHCRKADNEYYILNMHGLWNGNGKTDTPARLAQAQRIRDFIDTLNKPHVLCGDFNLRPDTKSIEIIADGMNDLIKNYGIQSTRTSYYTKVEKFADYVFTSPNIIVHSFRVLDDVVSDHAALEMDFT